ncbi:MAG TPA: DUF1206 domain-containing protein [Polyangia bacterium]|nr:DUF1206 domain-containing protein [Polyangia bacterium]
MFRFRRVDPLAMAPRAARRALSWAEPWPDWVARGGYIAKGALFLLIGGLAAAAAAGWGGETTDPSGALAAVARAPAGRLILMVATLALLAHAAFRAVLVLISEPYDDRGPVWRGLRRIANAGSTLVYLGLSLTAGALALGARAQAHADKDHQARHWSGRVLSAPFGRLLLIGVAVAILVAAAVQVVRAFSPHAVRRRLRVEDMSDRERLVVLAVGRLALLARATVLGSVGYFLIKAAARWSPQLARGPAGALHAVRELPHGNWLLGLVAAGLLAVGAFALLEARWRRLFRR